jgi:hypothetical protein
MEEQEAAFTDEEMEADAAAYARLDELEKLETIIAYMEELNIATLDAARTRYATLEQAIESDDSAE